MLDAGSFDGVVERINQDDAVAYVRSQHHSEGYEVVICHYKPEMLDDLRACVGKLVRIWGTGSYLRGKDGSWRLLSMKITEFNPLRQLGLREAIDEIRAMDIHWPDDVMQRIEAEREE